MAPSRIPAFVQWAAPLMVFATAGLRAAVAHAEPQATVGLTIGAAGTSPDARPATGTETRRYWSETDFHLGFRGDVLFGRSKNADFGIGPYAEVMTHAFDELQFGGGVSGLLPVLDSLPIVLSAGGYGRAAKDGFGVTPGIAAELFWGSRSYNYHSHYVMAAGLLTEFRYGLGDNHETSIVVGAQLDLVMLSLPFAFLINAARGGSHDTDPVQPTKPR